MYSVRVSRNGVTSGDGDANSADSLKMEQEKIGLFPGFSCEQFFDHGEIISGELIDTHAAQRNSEGNSLLFHTAAGDSRGDESQRNIRRSERFSCRAGKRICYLGLNGLWIIRRCGA